VRRTGSGSPRPIRPILVSRWRAVDRLDHGKDPLDVTRIHVYVEDEPKRVTIQADMVERDAPADGDNSGV